MEEVRLSKEERRARWEESLREREVRRRAENVAYDHRREVLKSLGFGSYIEYLNSSLWKKIRDKIIVLGGKCTLCWKQKATQVHHLDYELDTLTGERLEGLSPLCSKCHRRVEFSHKNKR